jgi:hypothetical protein
MSNIKHTPGPWEVKTHPSRFSPETIIEDGVCGPDGEQIRVHGMTLTSSEEAKANSRLIASAPDLLQALEIVLEREQITSATRALIEHTLRRAKGG